MNSILLTRPGNVSFLGSFMFLAALLTANRYLSPSFRPRPRMRGLASDRICKFEQPPVGSPGGAAVLYPVLGIGSGCGRWGSSSRAGGTFGQLLLWRVVRWTRHCQPLALQQHCPQAPTTGILPILSLSVPEHFKEPAFVYLTVVRRIMK